MLVGCMRLFLCLLSLSLGAAEVSREITFKDINTALGIELLTDDNLWDDEAKVVAERLKWPIESVTSNEISYRLYPDNKYRLLSCRPYSCSILTDIKNPISISVMFANKGDSVTYSPGSTGAQGNRQISNMKRAIQGDAADITSRLSELFGSPTFDKLGQARGATENVKRWDWNGHAFLLASPRDEYVALRIVSSRYADDGDKSRISDAEMKARASERVEHRPNGDVILKDVPMVNQGPKGYCVPASWERVMRYMAVPADMYVLAMSAGTKDGGGTSTNAIATAAKSALLMGGRKIQVLSMKVDPSTVAKYIDSGLPLIWAMYTTPEYNAVLNSRMKERAKMTEPLLWKKTLSRLRVGQRPFLISKDYAHVCIIIGYNKQTGEVAVSDSWGPEAAERWVLGLEANQVSQGEVTVISF